MLESAEQRDVMSRNGRQFAEAAFDITGIASRFESIIHKARLDRSLVDHPLTKRNASGTAIASTPVTEQNPKG
jgi:hypothetical protein